MLKKNKQFNLVLDIFILFLFVFSLIFILQTPPLTANISLSSTNKKDNLLLPVRLIIPSIKVDAAVEYLGIASDGTMDVPKGPADVAWFNLGPYPGENGSAVIAGHSGWKEGKKAVFDNLYKLHKGDKIYIKNKKGIDTIFVVREFRNYDQNADASVVFSSSDGKSHLNFITCEGVWNEKEKGRPNRLVVFTDKE